MFRRWLGRPLGMLLVLALGGYALFTDGVQRSGPQVVSRSDQPSLISGWAYVRDGDTIEVSGVAVRLQGLHCPEAGEPGGSAATSAVRGLTSGQHVTCSLTGERTYDRIVGTCHVGDTDLTAALIREGVCARCPRYDPWMRYLPAQLQAGSWRGSMPGYCR